MFIKNGFTMIELVFVIVVLGILAAVAVPKFAATRDDANIAKARSDVSAVRSAIISERQTRLFRGDARFIQLLDQAPNGGGNQIFGGLPAGVMPNTNGALRLLQYPITTRPGNGGWNKTGPTTYTFTTGQGVATFTYNPADGTFDCAGGAGTACALLTD